VTAQELFFAKRTKVGKFPIAERTEIRYGLTLNEQKSEVLRCSKDGNRKDYEGTDITGF